RVRVVEEATFLDQQAPRVDAGARAAVPAQRPLADGLLHRLDGLLDVLALLLFGELPVLDPAPAVRADVEAGLADRGGDGRVALEGERAAEHGHRQAALLEDAEHAPEAHAAAVLEH